VTGTGLRDSSPAPSRAPSRGGVNSKLFWLLMEAWAVPDEAALALIGHPGKPGRTGKRPRFRLNTRQAELLGYLQEIDRTALEVHGDVPAWLNRRLRGEPMVGRTPLQAMTEGGVTAMAAILRGLTRTAMQRALRTTAKRQRART
jgi:hypothetical protein